MLPPGCISVGILSPDASAQGLHQTEALLLRPSLLVDSNCCIDHEPAIIHTHLTFNVTHKHHWMLSTSVLARYRSRFMDGFSANFERSRCCCSGEQIQSQIKGLVLLDATIPQAWERVVQLSLGKRPGTSATLHIYFEIMGRYAIHLAKFNLQHQELRRCHA